MDLRLPSQRSTSTDVSALSDPFSQLSEAESSITEPDQTSTDALQWGSRSKCVNTDSLPHILFNPALDPTRELEPPSRAAVAPPLTRQHTTDLVPTRAGIHNHVGAVPGLDRQNWSDSCPDNNGLHIPWWLGRRGLRSDLVCYCGGYPVSRRYDGPPPLVNSIITASDWAPCDLNELLQYLVVLPKRPFLRVAVRPNPWVNLPGDRLSSVRRRGSKPAMP